MNAYARNTDPETSHEAAATLPTAAIEQAILKCLNEHGGLTTSQITELTGIARVTVSPRMAPMKREGRVWDTPERRKHGSTKAAIVWVAI